VLNSVDGDFRSSVGLFTVVVVIGALGRCAGPIGGRLFISVLNVFGVTYARNRRFVSDVRSIGDRPS